MKKWIWAAAAALLAWNLYLTISLNQLKQNNTAETTAADGSGVIQNTVEGYTTDITETASEVMPKLVSISAISDQSEHIMSGVVYASIGNDTWILSASRWLSEDSQYIIRFDNGLSCEAELYGVDPVTDLGLFLSHPEFETEPIRIGASNALSQGEYVIAAGGRNIHTQAGEVSFGVVSKPGQYYSGTLGEANEWISEGILTDLVITDNLMGGALVNLSGQMVGILTPALSDSRSGAVALGINEAVLIAEQLRTQGTIQRAYLGLITYDVRNLELYQKTAMNIPMDVNSGIVIAEVMDGSPGQEAGLAANDVITMINDVSINNSDTLKRQQYQMEEGDTITITYIRSGNTNTVTVNLR